MEKDNYDQLMADIDAEEQAELEAVRERFDAMRAEVQHNAGRGGAGSSGRGRGRGGRASESPSRGGGRGSSPVRADWNCPACGDFQFARNTKCRKCGALPPSNASTPSSSRAKPQAKKQDWTCLLCRDRQFARNDKCRKCGSPRPTAEDVAAHEEEQRQRKEIEAQQRELARLEEIQRKAEEDAIKKAMIETMSRTNNSDCWAMKYVIPYFEVDGYDTLSVTTEDDDWAGYKDTPLNERGFRLKYVPTNPPHRKYLVFTWSTYGNTRNESESYAWSEAEMLYYTSLDPCWHGIFSSTRYDNSLENRLKRT